MIKMNLRNNWGKIPIVIISILIICSSLFFDIDKKGDELITNSLKTTISVFTISKVLNSAISLAQSTQISIPVLTISIGEVLDPINDLIEQFSWVMLASITSLGIQKILINFVRGDLFNILIIISLTLVNILMFVKFQNDKIIKFFIFKFTIIMIFFRFSIPMISIVNNFIYENYIKQNYNIEKINNEIEKTSKTINSINEDSINIVKMKNHKQDILGNISENFLDVFNGVKNIFNLQYYKDKISKYKQATQDISEHILKLITAFVFKEIFFPIIFLFIIYKMLIGTFQFKKDYYV